MFKKQIKYVDFDEKEQTKTFYFHLSEAELAELEVSTKGGLKSYMEALVEAEDVGKIIEIFKKIILMSVGIKSTDGQRFIKNEEVRNEFEQCPAYSVLFMELSTNTESAVNFMNELVGKAKQRVN